MGWLDSGPLVFFVWLLLYDYFFIVLQWNNVPLYAGPRLDANFEWLSHPPSALVLSQGVTGPWCIYFNNQSACLKRKEGGVYLNPLYNCLNIRFNKLFDVIRFTFLRIPICLPGVL